MKKVYSDAFVLHDETLEDPHEMKELEEKLAEKGGKLTQTHRLQRKSTKTLLMPDTRKDLDNTWTKFFKYQPLWKVRNYFGEKIALYFAWSGTLISTLWIPTLFGICVFIYGLYRRFELLLSILRQTSSRTSENSNCSHENIFFQHNWQLRRRQQQLCEQNTDPKVNRL